MLKDCGVEVSLFLKSLPDLLCTIRIPYKLSRLIWKAPFCGCPILKCSLPCKKRHTCSEEKCFKMPHYHIIEPAFRDCGLCPWGLGGPYQTEHFGNFHLVCKNLRPCLRPAPSSQVRRQSSEYKARKFTGAMVGFYKACAEDCLSTKYWPIKNCILTVWKT